jgi:hypothetical protein
MDINEDGNALILIPDITGFTRFMAENDIEFSRKIIPPLLRNIVNSNMLNLKVGEIEGDAVVFYRFGTLPHFKALADQCTAFYVNFNEQLKALMLQYADDFNKYVSSNRLSLKVVAHSALMTSTHIEGFPKLIGEDMVVVHKLLKNSIKEPEYILLTEKLLSKYSSEEVYEVFNPDKIKAGMDEYEYIGKIKYSYIVLDPQLNGVQVTKSA